ncbi:transmembrane and coiled-coil domain-containing protein 6 isoform X1 [Chroicocephalus ridibundus]|uniref:transmembrane and coiled-coil domain-containing protein 6 isoform X1 n=1 Tax=Chroicocephalus ridibundus TaxID=1192867 RepID=UPI002FDCFFFF
MWGRRRRGAVPGGGRSAEELRARRREREAALRKARRQEQLVSKRLLREETAEEGGQDGAESVPGPLSEDEVLQLLRGVQRGSEDRKSSLGRLRWALQNKETQQKFVRLDGSIRTLIGLFTSSLADMQMEAARCLHELSHSSDPAVAEACLPVTSYLLTYLSGHSVEFTELCLYTLGNLVVESEAVRKQLLPQGIIPVLASCIQSPHEAVLEGLGYVLSQLLQAKEAPTEIVPTCFGWCAPASRLGREQPWSLRGVCTTSFVGKHAFLLILSSPPGAAKQRGRKAQGPARGPGLPPLGKATPLPSWAFPLSEHTHAVCRITGFLYRVITGDKPEEAVPSPLNPSQIASPRLELSPALPKASPLNPVSPGRAGCCQQSPPALAWLLRCHLFRQPQQKRMWGYSKKDRGCCFQIRTDNSSGSVLHGLLNFLISTETSCYSDAKKSPVVVQESALNFRALLFGEGCGGFPLSERHHAVPSLCSHTANAVLLSLGALPALTSLLLDMASEIPQDAPEGLELLVCPVLRCLSNLLAEETGCEGQIQDERLLIALFLILQSFFQQHPFIVQECLWLLNNLTADEPFFCSALLSLDLLPALLQLLPCSQMAGVLVLTVLCNVAEKGPAYCQQLHHQPALPLLLPALALPDPEVVGQCLELLHLLFLHCPEAAADFVRQGGHRALEQHQSTPELQERVRALLDMVGQPLGASTFSSCHAALSAFS